MNARILNVIAELDGTMQSNTVTVRRGPMAAIDATNSKVVTERDRCEFLEVSRLSAILGSCARSHKSVRSGIRCWMAFVGNEFSPCVT